MKAKILKGFCTLVLGVFLINYVENSDNHGFLIMSVNGQNTRAKIEKVKSELSDKDILEIVKLLIYSTKVNSESICFEKKTLYFSKNELSKYVLDNFPKKIKDCETVLINENEIGKDFKNDYHRFNNWSLKDGFVYVTFSTEFRGGNQGGGDITLVRKKGRWAIKSSEWWATAS